MVNIAHLQVGHYQTTKMDRPVSDLLAYLPDPEVIKHFSCSTQLSMKFVLLINLKLLTTANSFLLNTTEHENSSANKYENANSGWHFHIYMQRKFHAQLSRVRKVL